MLVFIDESGDAGFKVTQGSTPVFATAMVIFEDRSAAQRAENLIKNALRDLRAFPEFKFNKSSDEIRDGFFTAVRSCDFRVRALVVKKADIYSDRLRSEKDEFYRYIVKSMVKHDGGMLQGAKVIIDGSGERSFRRDLEKHIKRHAGPSVKSVKFAASHTDPLVQLADMVVGAIARSYRTDRGNADRWRKMLKSKIDDIWEFK